LNSWLQQQFRKYWKPSRDVAVDECKVRFTGRSYDITTIPSKPIPIGYKVWAIAQVGYIALVYIYRANQFIERLYSLLALAFERL
jgi:hypothetical protein